jgi:hypothetical protein
VDPARSRVQNSATPPSSGPGARSTSAVS